MAQDADKLTPLYLPVVVGWEICYLTAATYMHMCTHLYTYSLYSTLYLKLTDIRTISDKDGNEECYSGQFIIIPNFPLDPALPPWKLSGM